MMRVLRPFYERTGESTLTQDGKMLHWERVSLWIPVGYAKSAEDAKAKFPPVVYGYALVMEEA
jgi:hypothetical protein